MTHQIDPAGVKALALDLDGTILRPDATLSGRTIRTLKACMARGIGVIICTGRSSNASESYRQAIGATGSMVYYNGAVVMDMPEAKILNASFLEPGLARYCVDLARDLGVYFHIFLPGTPDSPAETLLAERYGEESEVYRNRTGLKPRIVDLKAALDSPGVRCIKGMFIAEPAVLAAVQERLEQQFGGRFYGARSYVSFLEILAPGVSKGHGLRRALEYRGLPPSQTIAFGDEENDLPLFEAAGFSAAPANAQEQILRAADIHIGPNSEDGVAAFLESLFDIGPP